MSNWFVKDENNVKSENLKEYVDNEYCAPAGLRGKVFLKTANKKVCTKHFSGGVIFFRECCSYFAIIISNWNIYVEIRMFSKKCNSLS